MSSSIVLKMSLVFSLLFALASTIKSRRILDELTDETATSVPGDEELLNVTATFLPGYEVTYDSSGIVINSQRRLILAGSIHYPRSTQSMWPDLVQKAKDGGLNTIDTYVFWNLHEPLYRQYDFDGNKDLIAFVKIIQNAGMHAVLRLGPYISADSSFGGFPVWLRNMPYVEFRTENEVFQREMRIFTTHIVNMMLRNKLFASQGGPIILGQSENQYGEVIDFYGEKGRKYMQWCADLANSFNVKVPWIMNQKLGAPKPIINTCSGFYCDQWKPNNPGLPKLFSENAVGGLIYWGHPEPYRMVEDLAFSVARFFQLGGAGHNYYMYHGGTNFGRTNAGPFATTSYDYGAPLDEYGNLNQPTWGHLKKLHELLMVDEEIFLNGVRNDNKTGYVTLTEWGYRGRAYCFVSNEDPVNDQKFSYYNTDHIIPAWSCSILPDCVNEAYNTAKVSAQTSVMVKLPAADGVDDQALEWVWWNEKVEAFEDDLWTVKDSDFVTYELLDQKHFNDTSDYLWYMTSIYIDESDPLWGKKTILSVHTYGQVLHVFFNGKYIGTNFSAQDFIYEQKVKLVKGQNRIVLLSGLVGIRSYAPFLERYKSGVVGSVLLIGSSHKGASVTKDLSKKRWTYKVGIEGERRQLFNPYLEHGNWRADQVPSNSRFVWYKATFSSILGTDPVVLDLSGLNKGMAWINGNSLGRYWPSRLAPMDHCNITCDYRGQYSIDKCLTNCGNPTQRWYHVPRDFINKNGPNEVILFEEFGGNPWRATFQTVTVGKACGNAYYGSTLELSCQGGRTFTSIAFASYGDPTGDCGLFEKGQCDAPNTMSVVEQACIGKTSCSFSVINPTFGFEGCGPLDRSKFRLAIEAIC